MIEVWSKTVFETEPAGHIRRDDERRDARAVAPHRRPVVGGRGRLHVVEEAAVLVVGDHEQRLRQAGLCMTASTSWRTSFCPARRSEGGWSSFEPAGPNVRS